MLLLHLLWDVARRELFQVLDRGGVGILVQFAAVHQHIDVAAVKPSVGLNFVFIIVVAIHRFLVEALVIGITFLVVVLLLVI